MHRDDLAGLGESLRRELQDLVVGGPAALADLEADARRLLALLDGDLRELGDWLTSPSIEVDLPEEADEAPESVAAARRAPERGADGQGRAGTYTDGAPRDSMAAVPLEMAVSGVPQPPPAGAFAPVKSLRDLAQWVRETSVGEPARLEWENLPVSEPGAVSAAAVRSVSVPVRPGKPAAAAPRAEISGAAEAASSAPEDENFAGVEAGLGKPPLRGWPSLPNPSLPASPPPTGREGLQDSLRLLSPSSPVRSGGGQGEEGRGDEGQRTEDAESDKVELGATIGSPGFQSRAAEAADAPEETTLRFSGRHWDKPGPRSPAPPSAASPAGEPLRAPFPEAAEEVDVESLLEALARSVADEYKRFYGS